MIFIPEPGRPHGVGEDKLQAVSTNQCSPGLQIFMAGCDWLWVKLFPLESLTSGLQLLLAQPSSNAEPHTDSLCLYVAPKTPEIVTMIHMP